MRPTFIWNRLPFTHISLAVASFEFFPALFTVQSLKATSRLTIIELEGPSVNSRPGLYFLKESINPWTLNGTGFYSEEASIQGNMLHILHNDRTVAHTVNYKYLLIGLLSVGYVNTT